jgi:vacuolar-type H+-ATPase subunit F/Vma7
VARVWYIGDEATALAYRLAGVETRVPGAGETPVVYARAIEDGADLVLLAPPNAAELGPDALAAALASLHPLVELVPDWQGRHEVPDVAHGIRLALGIEP